MSNPALEAALAEYDQVAATYMDALREHGVEFAEAGKDDAACEALREQLQKTGKAIFRNAGASIVTGWLSPACVECTGADGSETFSTTFKCHRDCYFCFNANQADYEKFFREGCPWEDGLERAAATTPNLACVGLTGGEPLLNLDETIEFLQQAQRLFPTAHKRMYTSGDLLTEQGAQRLRDAGLQEIRFSVKFDDTDEAQEKVLAAMELATRYIPDVMVEMPIIPGTEDRMKELFGRWSSIGIKGINLLEFCFPFHNWDEFAKRGFTVRNPPFPVMYDYGYSGGLAISGSEELCLSLMLWGIEQEVPFGMHYCSLENKHRSEMRQMNERGANMHPCFKFDGGDFFLKTAKVFGDDCAVAKPLLQAAGCDTFLENDDEQSLTFSPDFASALENSGVTVATGICVLESENNQSYVREIGLTV